MWYTPATITMIRQRRYYNLNKENLIFEIVSWRIQKVKSLDADKKRGEKVFLLIAFICRENDFHTADL
jgi:hypothetical protein